SPSCAWAASRRCAPLRSQQFFALLRRAPSVLADYLQAWRCAQSLPPPPAAVSVGASPSKSLWPFDSDPLSLSSAPSSRSIRVLQAHLSRSASWAAALVPESRRLHRLWSRRQTAPDQQAFRRAQPQDSKYPCVRPPLARALAPATCKRMCPAPRLHLS